MNSDKSTSYSRQRQLNDSSSNVEEFPFGKFLAGLVLVIFVLSLTGSMFSYMDAGQMSNEFENALSICVKHPSFDYNFKRTTGFYMFDFSSGTKVPCSKVLEMTDEIKEMTAQKAKVHEECKNGNIGISDVFACSFL